jgi:hypothetical protein
VSTTCHHCRLPIESEDAPIADGAWFCPGCGQDESPLTVERVIVVRTALHALDAANLALNTEGVLLSRRPIGDQVRGAAVRQLGDGSFEVTLNPIDAPPGAELFDVEQMLAW